jgi:3-hydroxyacyl-[acyl-carrier-protein] dehydratase
MRFLLVDRLVALEPGIRAQAETTLSADQELFQDHFPGFPVVPGVLLTEMMAQTVGKCLNAENRPRGLAMLIEIRNARFRHWARPGELISLAAEIVGNSESVARASATAKVGGKVIASCELTFSFAPRESFSPEYHDRVLEDFHRDC